MIFTPAYPPCVFKAFYLLKVYLGYRRCIYRYINVYFMYIFLYSFQCMPFVLCRTARVWRAFPSLGVHILVAVVLESCHRKFLYEFQLSPFFLIHSKFLNICKSKFICIYSLSQRKFETPTLPHLQYIYVLKDTIYLYIVHTFFFMSNVNLITTTKFMLSHDSQSCLSSFLSSLETVHIGTCTPINKLKKKEKEKLQSMILKIFLKSKSLR